MSGLYNLMFGTEPLSRILLAMLGLTPGAVPRFRDCYLSDHPVHGPCIVVYTRTGGGNREEYEDDNQRLTEVAGYLGDKDDTFDNTYAKFAYRLPDEVRQLYDTYGPAMEPDEKFKAAIAALQAQAKT